VPKHMIAQPATAAGRADDATEVVTQIGLQLDQLAYSEEEPGDEVGVANATPEGPVSRLWREAWGRSAAIVSLAALVAVVIVIGFVSTRMRTDEHSAPTSTTPAATSTLPAAALPSTTAAPPPSDPDELFLQRVRSAGLPIADPKLAVSSAKMTCREFDHGLMYGQLVDEIRNSWPMLTPLGVRDYIAAVVQTYCPRYTNMLDETKMTGWVDSPWRNP
jgi:hypothetical protein